ncbi:hypothetical protein MKS88_000783 [Plasmodium brasilianum]|uniref:Uncharacterized protein n=1 Tax=Plasmodium brasilianum TaxID=5824 RepID=A0ACB9YEX2_PLABR|nr:hypothetical protein MKS88_000783 [Plasmodium brasilianum]
MLAHHSFNGKCNGRHKKLLDENYISEYDIDTLSVNEELKESSLNSEEWDGVAKSNKSSLFNRMDVFCEKQIFNFLDSFYQLMNKKVNNWDEKRTIRIEIIKLALIPLSLLMLSLFIFLKLCSIFKDLASNSSSGEGILLAFTLAMFSSIIYGIFYAYKKYKKYKMIKKK